MTKTLNDKYGEEKAKKLGYKLGVRLGKMAKMLDTMYVKTHTSFSIMEQKAIIYFKELTRLPRAEIVPALEQNAKSCRWFDIPLLPMINGLEIGTGK